MFCVPEIITKASAYHPHTSLVLFLLGSWLSNLDPIVLRHRIPTILLLTG